MKFHNFVSNEMYVHFSSRVDKYGDTSDDNMASQFIGGVITKCKQISTPGYWFESHDIEYSYCTSGSSGCYLPTKYQSRICKTGMQYTYLNITTAIKYLTKKISQGSPL